MKQKLGWSFGWMIFFLLFVSGLNAKEIRVSVTYYSAQTESYFKEAAKAFTKQSGAEVKVEVVSWDNMLQKLITDISADKNADIAIIGNRWLLDFVDQDLIEPLNDYISPELKANFIETLFEPLILNKKIYGLPIAASSRAMYYNKDLFRRAGIKSPPKTWDELKTAARKISKLKNAYGFGIQGKEIEMEVYWFYAFWAFGGKLIQNGKSAIDSPAGIASASFYQSLINEKLAQPGVTSYSREDVQNLFKKGNLGMVITAPFLINQIEEEAPKLNYGVAMVPRNKTQATFGAVNDIVIFKNSKNKKLAFEFLKLIFQDEWRSKFTRQEGFLPVNKRVAKEPYFSEDPRRRAFTEMLPYAKFSPTVLGWQEAAKIISDTLQKIYLGADPAKELKAAAKKMSRAINSKR